PQRAAARSARRHSARARRRGDRARRRRHARGAQCAVRGDVIAAAAILAAANAVAGPSLAGLAVSDGAAPFTGDSRLLTTVSPNGDGFRDAAIVRFHASEPVTARLDALATQQIGEQTSQHVVWSTSTRLARGAG